MINQEEATLSAAQFRDMFEKFVRASGETAFVHWLSERPKEGEAKQERELLPRQRRR